MSNFYQRILTGTAFVAIIILSLITHPIAFALLILLFNSLALLEYRKMDKILSSQSPIWIYVNTFIFAGLLVFALFNYSPQLNLLGFFLMLIFLYLRSIYIKDDHRWDFLVKSVFGCMYISLPLFMLNMLHLQSVSLDFSVVLILFVLIWINDSFAYVFGLWLGKHRLFERISPKKSWEGFFGGLVMTLVAAWLFSRIYLSLNVYEWLIFGLLCTLSAVYGDFIESMLKRSAKVKDSGSLLPGHGGVLDRIDSLLLVAPVVFLFLLVLNNF